MTHVELRQKPGVVRTQTQVPYLRLEGAPREGLVVTTVTSVADFVDTFPHATEEERAAVYIALMSSECIRMIDVIHGPEQKAKSSSPA